LLGVYLIGNQRRAFMVVADTLHVTAEILGIDHEKIAQDIGVVLPLFAHAAVLHVQGDALEESYVALFPFPRLDRLEDLDRVIEAELAGVALGAHAVL
jgi:hypothetical protein